MLGSKEGLVAMASTSPLRASSRTARGALLDLAADRLLQFGLDADLHVLAGDALTPVELADDAADGVDLDLHRAGPAAQDAVVEALHPRAADPDARQLQQRVVAHIALPPARAT